MRPKVDPQNDPRPIVRGLLSDFEGRHPRPLRRYADTDSDPSEPDIDDHFAHGPGGFFGRRTIFRSPENPTPQNTTRTPPDDGENIIRRFTEMLRDMNNSPEAVGRSGPDTSFPETDGPHVTYRTISGPGFRAGVSSFTITTAPGGGRIRQGGISPGPPGDEDFTRYDFLRIRSLGYYLF